MKFAAIILLGVISVSAMEGLRCKCKGEPDHIDYVATNSICQQVLGKDQKADVTRYCWGAAQQYCDLDGQSQNVWDTFRAECLAYLRDCEASKC